MRNIINELDEYISLDNTEIGEICSLLIDISRYPDYVSEKFYSVLEKEIESQLNNFKNNTKIVQDVISHNSVTKKLEWI